MLGPRAVRGAGPHHHFGGLTRPLPPRTQWGTRPRHRLCSCPSDGFGPAEDQRGYSGGWARHEPRHPGRGRPRTHALAGTEGGGLRRSRRIREAPSASGASHCRLHQRHDARVHPQQWPRPARAQRCVLRCRASAPGPAVLGPTWHCSAQTSASPRLPTPMPPAVPFLSTRPLRGRRQHFPQHVEPARRPRTRAGVHLLEHTRGCEQVKRGNAGAVRTCATELQPSGGRVRRQRAHEAYSLPNPWPGRGWPPSPCSAPA
jgi:hypothetical protein